MIVTITLLGALFAADPTAPLATPVTVVVVAKPEGTGKSDPTKLICRNNDAIGSRLKRERRCFTSSEWEEIRQLDRRAIDRIQANRYSGQ